MERRRPARRTRGRGDLKDLDCAGLDADWRKMHGS